LETSVNTLALHEQDSNVGACATAAIWSVFQKAAENYYVNLKSQIEITKDAGQRRDGQRMIPNTGLTLDSMNIALTKNDLETEMIDLTNTRGSKYLRRIISAYSPIGIPVILCINIPDERGNFAGHAVAVCGHLNETKTFSTNDNDDIICEADFMSQIYYHDDQWGPFIESAFPSDVKEESVNMNIYENSKEFENKDFDFIKDKFIDSTWTEIETENGEYKCTYMLEEKKINHLIASGKKKLYATILYAIIPVFPKVRINYDHREKNIRSMQYLLKSMELVKSESWAYCNWDISLKYSHLFKSEFRNYQSYSFVSEQDSRNFKFTVLSQSLPKYIWVATMYFGGNKYITFIFDATGLVDVPLLLHVLFYIPELKRVFASALQKSNIESSGMNICDELVDGCLHRNNFFI
jgi:hypothetical protein